MITPQPSWELQEGNPLDRLFLQVTPRSSKASGLGVTTESLAPFKAGEEVG